jgi:LuxR family transcriptional regulator/LuxR family quorum-sensing system transcriptional regulator SolR
LSITVDESSEDWDHFKNTYMRDLQILALYFHKSVLEVNNVSPPDFNLTNRELDILYWSACGKSSEDTGAIIGISKSTVRFHVSNILTKLNAVNITHAVGKAIFYGLIGRPS